MSDKRAAIEALRQKAGPYADCTGWDAGNEELIDKVLAIYDSKTDTNVRLKSAVSKKTGRMYPTEKAVAHHLQDTACADPILWRAERRRELADELEKIASETYIGANPYLIEDRARELAATNRKYQSSKSTTEFEHFWDASNNGNFFSNKPIDVATLKLIARETWWACRGTFGRLYTKKQMAEAVNCAVAKEVVNRLNLLDEILAKQTELLAKEGMQCPKCKFSMRNEKDDDWFCDKCQELWCNGSARKYQQDNRLLAEMRSQAQGDGKPCSLLAPYTEFGQALQGVKDRAAAVALNDKQFGTLADIAYRLAATQDHLLTDEFSRCNYCRKLFTTPTATNLTKHEFQCPYRLAVLWVREHPLESQDSVPDATGF